MLTLIPSANSARHRSNWLLCALLALGGCAGKPIEIGSLYQRLGEEKGIATLVDDLMRNIEQDPRIKANFAKADLPQLKQALTTEICAIGSGPCSNPVPAAQTTLQGLKITNDGFDAFIGNFAKTLDEHEVGPNTQRELLFPLKALRGNVIDMSPPADAAAPIPAPAKPT